MVVEILAIMIRNNDKINGIKIQGNECKLNQYAEDTFIATHNTDDSVQEIFKLINEFSICFNSKQREDGSVTYR